jgi:hypothetical protein
VTAVRRPAQRLRSRRKAVANFYDRVLTAAEREDLARAMNIEGVDEEIALLRLRLRSLIEQRPNDLPLMLKGIDLLARAVTTRYRLAPAAEEDMATALRNVIKSLGVLWPEVEHGSE